MFHFTGGAAKGKEKKKAPETLILGKEAGDLLLSYFLFT